MKIKVVAILTGILAIVGQRYDIAWLLTGVGLVILNVLLCQKLIK